MNHQIRGSQYARFKNVGESARERETFKYYPTPLNCIRKLSGGLRVSPEPTSCNGAVLTALAQAGVAQTGTDRSFISLFDAEYQYIIAEATPTSRLQPWVKNTESERLWLCGTAIPRGQSICELSLLADSAQDLHPGKDNFTQLPLTLSERLATDPRFSSKLLCQRHILRQFYAAVPIRTRRGIDIGVYCVISETPDFHWNDGQTGRLRDISQIIMAHLESKRRDVLYRRSVRMNRGLGSFIEGESTLVGLADSSACNDLTNQTDSEGKLNAAQQRLVKQFGVQDDERRITSFAADVLAAGLPHEEQQSDTSNGTLPASRISCLNNNGSPKNNSSASDENDPATILSKAANLLRESMEVEGCVFLDAAMEAYRAPAQTRYGVNSLEPLASSSSDDSLYRSSGGQPLRRVSILGFSTSDKSSINGDSPASLPIALQEGFLAKLLRRYPRGKIFSFGADGCLQSSDSSDDDGDHGPISEGIEPAFSDSEKYDIEFVSKKRPLKPWARQREGTILAEAFPGARCVAFAPVWDPRKDRWYAGSFVYTHAPARHFTDVDELNYLRAFSILTMVEILRNRDLQADKAKSDILGSLSHELRSPLHGVISSAELLGETELSVFQSNAANTIEICSRTLLDTIDHLLHYSKINSFSRHRNQGNTKKTRPRGRSPSAADSNDTWRHEESLAKTCQLDGLIEEVIESVFAGHTFRSSSTTHPLSKPAFRTAVKTWDCGGRSISTQTDANSDALMAAETIKVSQELNNLCIIMHIDPRQNWSYFVQVGAIRRIIMNIFGNALKYTERGTIKVSMTQESRSVAHRKKKGVVKFTVEDTGKGISADFLQHGLFRPFSQEDTLSPGTGLGLSLVKRIVDEMHGTISVESEVGRGTTVSVVLPMEPIPRPDRDIVESDVKLTFEDHVTDLKGLRIGLVMSTQDRYGASSEWHSAIRSICSEWFTMEVVSNTSGANAPDILLWSHDQLPKNSTNLRLLSKTPNVVLCQNATVACKHTSVSSVAGHSAIFEYVAQPIGPRKLARALLLAYTRWMHVHATQAISSTTSTSCQSVGAAIEPQRLPKHHHSRRPSLHRGPSSHSTTSPTDDEAVFSDSKGEQIISPFSETGNPFNKFLLVDDNYINLKVLCAYLKKRGIEYDTALNGQEAVDLYCNSENTYNCVLMDISMPIMDGFEAARRIRAYERQDVRQRVPIVALSGLASEDVYEEAIHSGMNELLTKPVQLKTLGNWLESSGII